MLPSLVTNKLMRRDALIPETDDDYRWPATLVAHISTFGDFVTETCAVMGARGNPLVCGARGGAPGLIEGFSLDLAGTAPVGVEYRALMDDGAWTLWTSNGQFVGTRNVYRQIRGFSVRPVGEHALSVECVCVGSFVGRADLVIVGSGEECRGDDGATLEAMQVIFRPAFHDWSDHLAHGDEPVA